MATIDTRLQGMTRRMIRNASGGAQFTFARDSGDAPNVSTVSATVTALVRSYQRDTETSAREGYSASNLASATLGERFVMVMADDLAAQSFPVPLQKNDRMTSADTGETFVVSRVDPYKRAVAGAIEAYVTGR